MSDEKIYHQYTIGKKTKQIKSLSGLKRYCYVNKDNTLNFNEMLVSKGFIFKHNLKKDPIPHTCRLCNKDLDVFKIDEDAKTVYVSLCACNVKSSLAVNLERFKTIFSDEETSAAYSAYCANKMRKWTTENIPVSSLEFKIKKFGEEEGTKRYKDACKSMDSTSANYYEKQGFSSEEAIVKSKERQSTFSLKKCIEKHGEEEGRQLWAARQEKWLKKYKKSNYSKISQVLFKTLLDLDPSLSDSIFANRYSEDKNDEAVINSNSRVIKPDFYNSRLKKVIEFDGDYWHNRGDLQANVKRELQRDKALESLGIKILHVKEWDFKHDRESVIKKCKEFLCTP